MIVSKEIKAPMQSGQYLVVVRVSKNKYENHLAYYDTLSGWDLAENPNSKREIVSRNPYPFYPPTK